ncbi:MAG: hypothetical protein E6G66_18620 [Actinobacteria bacterium]|nr:MAG: hypothetical protein E6G66_18620 [Actinomycetota bacterium]
MDEPLQPVAVVANEFASVAVAVDHAGNGPRLRLEDLRTGRVGYLDAGCTASSTRLTSGGRRRERAAHRRRRGRPHPDPRPPRGS